MSSIGLLVTLKVGPL